MYHVDINASTQLFTKFFCVLGCIQEGDIVISYIFETIIYFSLVGYSIGYIKLMCYINMLRSKILDHKPLAYKDTSTLEQFKDRQEYTMNFNIDRTELDRHVHINFHAIDT